MHTPLISRKGIISRWEIILSGIFATLQFTGFSRFLLDSAKIQIYPYINVVVRLRNKKYSFNICKILFRLKEAYFVKCICITFAQFWYEFFKRATI